MADELGSKELRKVWYRWQENHSKDVIKAALRKEQDLSAFDIQNNFQWPQVWTEPPFLLPQSATNAQMINTILIKSWETQGSSCAGLPKIVTTAGTNMNVLFENKGFKIIALLNYYFKNLPLTQNVCRKIGMLDAGDIATAWSFLQVSHLYDIDNSFSASGKFKYFSQFCHFLTIFALIKAWN